MFDESRKQSGHAVLPGLPTVAGLLITLTPPEAPEGSRARSASCDRIGRDRREDAFKLGFNAGVAVASHPAWSPDDKRIAFVAFDGPVDVRSAITVGKTRLPQSTRKLTNFGHFDVSPTWSPDGKAIAFARGDTRAG